MRRLAARLSPDNIDPNFPDVHLEDGLLRVVVNPVPGVRVARTAVCLGSLFEESDWHSVGGDAPDGTYAIVRHDDGWLEVLTDVFASRSIWYVHNQDTFFASTSQRALISLLGDFQPCPEAVSWIVASGNLGPERGWDARLKRLGKGSCLRLDRREWTLSIESEQLRHAPKTLSPAEHRARLQMSVFDACNRLDVERSPSALTLSGGYDSRSLLLGLAHARKPVICLTWGFSSSLTDPKNDAYIARELARRFGIRHQYLLLEPTGEPMRDVLSRFLCAGEGRVEDFSGYTDGLRAWHDIFDSGIATIIRGDSPGWGFPFAPVNDFWVRSVVHEMTLVSDYPETEPIHRLGLAPQHPPEALFNVYGETLTTYRDRIYNDYELPSCMAAFNQVKSAYTEVVNPLFARGVVNASLELPDELRHMRCGFERMVSELVPDVPFAERGADEPEDHYLRRRPMREELLNELSSEDAHRVLSSAALEAVVADLERPVDKTRSDLRARVRPLVPRRLVRSLRPAPRPHIGTSSLAFRAYIASRMNAILSQDAGFLRGRN